MVISSVKTRWRDAAAARTMPGAMISLRVIAKRLGASGRAVLYAAAYSLAAGVLMCFFSAVLDVLGWCGSLSDGAAVGTAWAAEAGGAGGEAGNGGKKAGTGGTGLPGLEGLPAEVEWDAQRQYLDDEHGAVILTGAAWVRVRYKGLPLKLEADRVVLFTPAPEKGRRRPELYAEGNIRLRQGESEIAAQAAYVDVETGRGWLLDAVMRVSAPPRAVDLLSLRRKGSSGVGTGAGAAARVRDPYGVYLDPENDPHARANLVFKADRIIRENRLKYRAENAFISTDVSPKPMYGVKVRKLEVLLREKPDEKHPGKTKLRPLRVTGEGARLKLGPVALFPMPTINYDLSRPMPFMQSNSGDSSWWGHFAMYRVGWSFGSRNEHLFDLTRLYLDASERWKRGPGGGFELEWKTGRRPAEATEGQALERGRGHLRVYGLVENQTPKRDDILRGRRNRERRVQPKIDGFPKRSFDANRLFVLRRRLEDAGPPSLAVQTYRGDVRGEIDFQHHQPLRRFAGLDDIELDFKYDTQSDRDYRLEYSRRDHMAREQSEALASIRKAGDNYSAELLYRTRPQDFESVSPRSPVAYGAFTGYEPALTYSLTPTSIGRGFYLSGAAQGARLRRSFDRDLIDASDFSANRAYVEMEVERPFRWHGAVFRPHLGTIQSAYDDSRQGSGTFQGAMTYGLDVAGRIYGLWPELHNDALGVEGMRHVLEPRLEWTAVSDPRESAEDLRDFDAIDDLQPLQRIRFALDQVFQTKRPTREGGMRSLDFAALNMSLDLYPRSQERDRLLGGNALDLWRIDGFLRVSDAFRLTASSGVNIGDGELETAAYGFLIDPGTRWRFEYQERFNFGRRALKMTGSDEFTTRFEYRLSERWAVAYEQKYERRRGLLQNRGRQLERFTATRYYGALAASFTYSRDKNYDNSYYFTVRPVLSYRNLVVAEDDLVADAAELGGEGEVLPEEYDFDPFKLFKKRERERLKKKRRKAAERRRAEETREEEAPVKPKLKDIPIPLKKRPKDVSRDEWDGASTAEEHTPPVAPAAPRRTASFVRPD